MPNEESTPRSEEKIEERGVISEVVVPLAQSGVGGAVAAVVGNHLSKPKDEAPPPPPPPPPSDAIDE